jgi:MFS family permease
MNAPVKFTIPRLIKRNIALFALSQSFTGAGTQFLYGLTPLMVVSLSGSAALAGLSVGLTGVSRFLVAYPIGKITDTFGRKPGILIGLILALIGSNIIGFSMGLNSFAVLFCGILVFAMGMAASQQLRVGATDMVPPSHRATALGYVSFGSLAGLVLSPSIVNLSETFAANFHLTAFSMAWFFMPALILPGMLLISLVRPDPKEIGMHLEAYYPGFVPKRREASEIDQPFSARALLSNRRIKLAVVANAAGTGNMAIVMVMTSLVLSHHGHSLTQIASSHIFHTAGMFAFTIPLGKLADKFGRERVMLPSVAVALVGALLVAMTDGSYWLVTLGTFLVGLGWAGSNVAATALIADQALTSERGRAIGVNESFAGAANVAMALVTGPLIEFSGMPATGLVAAAIALPPLVMAGWFRLRGLPLVAPREAF